MALCECAYWGRLSGPLLTEHHKNCKKYDPLTEAAQAMNALLDGIEQWASDEDGVHPDCWDAYERASLMVHRGKRCGNAHGG